MSSTQTEKLGTSIDLFQIVTDRIINLLEKGTPPWRRTWGQYGMACNYYRKEEPYTGINMVMLNLVAPYQIPYYLTWNQIKEAGGQVIKGSKAEWVYFYKTYYKDANGKPISKEEAEKQEGVKKVSFLKRFKVFNVECISGMEFQFPKNLNRDNDTLANCEELIASMPEQPSFKNVYGNRAYYDPKADLLNLPNIKQFENSEAFYSTTFHELAHWTGHEKRLARPGIVNMTKFGSELYGEEELVAEMSACYLCAITGIDRENLMENNAAYIQGWLEKLREDKRLVFKAAAAAQKAVNYITGCKVVTT